jgi:hypothetical protein
VDYRKAILDIFHKRTPELIPWQPRLYYWYGARVGEDTLPARFRGKSLMEVYRALKVSPRYVPETLNIHPLQLTPEKVRIKLFTEDDKTITIYETPVGELTEVKTRVGLEERISEFPCKTVSDLGAFEYVLKDVTYSFLQEEYVRADRLFGELGVPQIYLLRRSPLQLLMLNLMGIERTIYALHDERAAVERFMKVCEETEDGMYDAILSSPLQIVNFGENLDSRLVSPELFERYLMPYYNERIGRLHQTGKFCHIHIDGHLKGFLPFFRKLDFDGFEALTASPQGDVEIEEIKEAVGDKILLDGIPAIMFLPAFPQEALIKFTQKVVDLFYPNLILGVSDELPPPAEIERVEEIREYLTGWQSHKK